MQKSYSFHSCVAKRQEIRRDEAVDFILTFEEIGSILDGMDIRLEQAQPFSLAYTSVREAHGFAQAGGVMGAVKAYLKEEADKINAIQVSDINKRISPCSGHAPKRAKPPDNSSR